MAWLGAILLCVPLALQADHHDRAGHGQSNRHMNQHPFEELAARFEDPARDAWQKPDQVLALLGDLRGRTVIDIGSGTGYFSFRLVDAGARVICADVDQRFLHYIRARMEREGVDPAAMQLRHVPYDSSGLRAEEVDVALIVNTYHHIENRVDYFAEVLAGLKPGGRLAVVDFFRRAEPVGPPVEMKLGVDTVVSELVRAGFSRFDINRELLPHQYIVQAFR